MIIRKIESTRMSVRGTERPRKRKRGTNSKVGRNKQS